MRLTGILLIVSLAGGCGLASADDDLSPPAKSTSLTAVVTDHYLVTARELIMQAMGYLGIRYKYGGETPETGFDCSGLVNYVYNKAAGLMLPRSAKEISQVGEKVTRDDLLPGDLVFFNTLRRPFSHVGIYLGEHRFIHAPSRGGHVEIGDMSTRYWKKRYNGARRVSH